MQCCKGFSAPVQVYNQPPLSEHGLFCLATPTSSLSTLMDQSMEQR